MVLGWLDKECSDPKVLVCPVLLTHFRHWLNFSNSRKFDSRMETRRIQTRHWESTILLTQSVLSNFRNSSSTSEHTLRESWPRVIHRRSNDFRGDQIASIMTIWVPKNNGNKGSLIGLIRLQMVGVSLMPYPCPSCI